MMKFFYSPLVLVSLVLVSCKFNPSQLGDDYCSCLKRFEQGKGTAEECLEMAESHNLKLQGDDEAMDAYTRHISDCLTFDDIRTNQDLRDDRKDRRSKQ
jgi:hypothetical protein